MADEIGREVWTQLQSAMRNVGVPAWAAGRAPPLRLDGPNAENARYVVRAESRLGATIRRVPAVGVLSGFL